jgi:hypothetical protein
MLRKLMAAGLRRYFNTYRNNDHCAAVLGLRNCLIRTEPREVGAVGEGPGRLARCPLSVGEPIPAVYVSRNAPDEAEYNEDISMYLPPTAIELNMCRSGIKSNESLCATIVALAHCASTRVSVVPSPVPLPEPSNICHSLIKYTLGWS